MLTAVKMRTGVLGTLKTKSRMDIPGEVPKAKKKVDSPEERSDAGKAELKHAEGPGVQVSGK